MEERLNSKVRIVDSAWLNAFISKQALRGVKVGNRIDIMGVEFEFPRKSQIAEGTEVEVEISPNSGNVIAIPLAEIEAHEAVYREQEAAHEEEISKQEHEELDHMAARLGEMYRP